MKELNSEKVAKAMEWIKKIIIINHNTYYCADFDLTGNWNQVEIRVYNNKDVLNSVNLLFESIDMHDDLFEDSDKIEEIDTVLNNILKGIPHEA